MKSAFLSINKACEYAGVSRPLLLQMIDEGLRSAKLGKRIKVKTDWIDDWYEKRADKNAGSLKEKASAILKIME